MYYFSILHRDSLIISFNTLAQDWISALLELTLAFAGSNFD